MRKLHFASAALLGAFVLFSSASGAQATRHHSRSSGSGTSSSAPAGEGAVSTTGSSEARGTSELAVLGSSGSIWHNRGRHSGGLEIETFGFVGPGFWSWPWGELVFGPGFRVGIPLVRNGPLVYNNDVRVNFGLLFVVWPVPQAFVWFASPITLQWNFFVTNRWSILAEIGLLFDVYFIDGANCYNHPQYFCDRFDLRPVFGAGVRMHGSSRSGFPAMTLRLEYPTGLQIGVSF